MSNTYDLLAVFIPLGVLCLFNIILFVLIIVGVYKKRSGEMDAEKEFEMCKFISGAIFISGKKVLL